MTSLRISLRRDGSTIADGPLGWGITSFEGNYYIGKKYLKSDRFKSNYVPGLCIYKFLYVWLDYNVDDATTIRSLGWMYWFPNPLFPFIWFRVAVPNNHDELIYDEY